MKELLKELFTSILSEDRKFKTVKIAGGEERVVPFKTQANADAAVAKGTHRKYDPVKDKDLPGAAGKKKSATTPTAPAKKKAAPAKRASPAKKTATKSKSPEEAAAVADTVVADEGDAEEVNEKGVYDEKDALQRAVVEAGTPQEIFDGLDKLAKDERTLAMDGGVVVVKGKKQKELKVGIGGIVPSTGETLCTDAQTAMLNGQYDPAAVRSSAEFTRLYTEIASTIKKPNKEIRLVADMYGLELYDETGQVDQEIFQECLQITAEMKMWVDKNDATLSKTAAGKAFGGREAREAWLQAAFHSGYSVVANGPADRDKNQPSRVLKANSRTDGAVQALLTRKRRDAKTNEERAHYDNQLEVYKKFQPYHDTFMVYTDTSGRTSVFHISNKKGADLQDPHNNTSPKRRLLNYLLAATKTLPKPNDPNDPAQVEASKAEAKRIAGGIGAADARARKGVDDIDATVWNGMSELTPTKKGKGSELALMGQLFLKLPQGQRENDVGDKYFVELTTPGSASGRLLIKAGVDRTDPQAVIAHILEAVARAEDPSTLPKIWADRVGIKFGALAQRVFEKMDDQGLTAEQTAVKLGLTAEQVSAIHKSETMKRLARVKKTHAAGLEGVNAEFVERLLEIDGHKPGHTGDNGNAVATYIQGTLQALHIDTYIKNYDENAAVESGGNGTKPIDVRNCMAKLSGFDGDTSTADGRTKLDMHLTKKLKVEPGSDAVYIFAADSKTKIYIAHETWRQSGKSKKVASGFGKDLRTCLSKEGSRRRRSARNQIGEVKITYGN